MKRTPEQPLLLLGCGIFRKEILFLSKKNGWQLETDYLDSALHIHYEKLPAELSKSIQHYPDRKIIVFYGSCHPRMDDLLRSPETIRPHGQNCIEMILGTDDFQDEVRQGAFFLFEEWAYRWDQIVLDTFGPKQEIMREIIQGDRKYMLSVITPCSNDFSNEAESAAKLVGLPLRWKTVNLNHLESVLQKAISQLKGDSDCRP